ncbi:MAG: sialidase family protein [Candidatus Kapaibacterium sp.]
MKTLRFVIAVLCMVYMPEQSIASDQTPTKKNIQLNPEVSLWSKNLSGAMTGKRAYNPQIIQSGSTIHVTWVADSTYIKRYIVYIRSVDNGATWEQPRYVYTYPSYANGGWNDGGANYYKMVVQGTSVHFFVSDYNQRGTWYGRLMYIRSVNNGLSFEAPRSLFEGNDAFHIYNVMSRPIPNGVAVVFLHKCNWTTADTCYYMKSTDNGTTFQRDTVYTTPAFSGSPDDVKIEGASVYVPFSWSYFYYGFNYGEQWIAVATNGGKFIKTKLSVPRSYNNNRDMSLITLAENMPSRVAVAGQNVYVLGYDYPEKGVGRMYISRSVNGGTTFLPPQTVTMDTGGIGIDFKYATIAAKGNYLYVVFTGAGNVMYMVRSTDGGTTMLPKQKLTSSNVYFTSLFSSAMYPRCIPDPNVADGSKVHIVGFYGLYTYSTNGGATFNGNVQLFPFSFREVGFVDAIVDNQSAIHVVTNGGAFYTTSVKTDIDIFYRKYSPTETYQQQSGSGNRCITLTNDPNQQKATGDHQYDLLQIPSSEFNNPNGSFTVEARFKPTSKDMSFLVVMKSASPTWWEYGTYYIRVLDGWLYANVATDSNAQYHLTSNAKLQQDNWYHVALTYNQKQKSDNVQLYINGTLQQTTTVKGNVLRSADPILMGYILDYNYNAHSVNIDEFRIWNRALTEQEIRAGMEGNISTTALGLTSYYKFDGNLADATGKGFPAMPMYRESFSSTSDSVLFISRITPTEAGNTGDATVTVLGSGFSSATKFKLQKSGQQDITASEVYVQNSKEVKAVFDIRGTIVGDWDIVASNSKETATLQKALAIKQGELPAPWVYVSGRRMILLNRWNSYTIYLGNKSNVDATGVPFWLAITNDPRIEIEFVDFTVGWSDESVKNGYDKQLASLPIYVTANKIQGESFNAKVYPLYISRIPANTTIALHVRIKAGMNFRFKAWINEPYYQSPFNVELAQCLVSSVTERLVDNTVSAIPAVGCIYEAGKLVHNPFDDYKGKKERTILSTIREWSGAALKCGTSLTGAGTIATFFVSFVSDLDNYVNDIRDCQKRFPRKSRFDGDVVAVSSFDPNSISGPHGYGTDNYTAKQTPHSYTVFFENKSSATAPAHEVFITDTLDKNKYDLTSFMFGSIDIGDTTLSIMPSSTLSTIADLRPKRNVMVRIQGSVDKTTGIIRWVFESLDPASMLPSEDPNGGFLPPNITPPQGEGSVSYIVNVRSSVAHKAQLTNSAQIVFDANAPLQTNTYSTVIDDRAPTSRVNNMVIVNDSTIILGITSSDDASGIVDVVTYMSVNDSAFVPITTTTTSNAVFTFFEGGKGKRYEFFSVARDSVGNKESVKNYAELTDVPNTLPNITTSAVTSIAPNPWSSETVIEFTIAKREHIRLELYDALGKVVKQLAEGMFEVGTYQIHLRDEYLPQGVYQCIINTPTTRNALATIRIGK